MATPAIRETGDATYGVSKLGRQAVGAPIRKCRVGRTAALLRFGAMHGVTGQEGDDGLDVASGGSRTARLRA
jgi:hypothetical protein